jgi:hypothetical protein
MIFRRKGYKKLPESRTDVEQVNFNDKFGDEIYWFLPAMSRQSYLLSVKQLEDFTQLLWHGFCSKHFDQGDPRYRDYLKASPDDLAWVFKSHKMHLQAKKHSALTALTEAIDQSPSIKYKIIEDDDIEITMMDRRQREWFGPYLDEYKKASEKLGPPWSRRLPRIEQFFSFANQQVKDRTNITLNPAARSATYEGFKAFTTKLATKKNNLHRPRPQ